MYDDERVSSLKDFNKGIGRRNVSNKLRVGIIGAGGIARAHIESFQAIDDLEIVALWNRSRERAEQLASESKMDGNVIVDEWREMMSKDRIDIVSIITAPQLRLDPIQAAFADGIHVVVEKPISLDLNEARQIAALARGTNCHSAVCHTWRYRSCNLIARRLIREDAIGAVTHYSSTWRFSWPRNISPIDFRPFMCEREGGQGLLSENGSHQFDMFSFLTGKSIDELGGRISWIESTDPPNRTNTSYHLVGSSENAVMTFEHTSPNAPFWMKSTRTVHIEGEKATIIVEGGLLDKGSVALREGEDGELRTVTAEELGISTQPLHMGLVADFVELIRSDGDSVVDGERKFDHDRPENLPTLDDGLKAVEAVQAAIVADKTKRIVNLSELDI